MPEPLRLHNTRVKPEWIDEYDHMNVAHYITVCDLANAAFWELMNAGQLQAQREGHEYVILENHVHYLRELAAGQLIHVTTQLLTCDNKRFVLFHRLWRSDDGVLAATNEAKAIGFNLNTRGIEVFLPEVQGRMAELLEQQKDIPTPPQAGQGIRLKR
jgi:YbgC/YbaW family acyl-CoA thioester hydrolase